jgi:hypothetical protein
MRFLLFFFLSLMLIICAPSCGTIKPLSEHEKDQMRNEMRARLGLAPEQTELDGYSIDKINMPTTMPPANDSLSNN